ncbi:Alsin [Nymphon striatum]|nr:Alsin [Nymphon striatum]
MAYGGQAQIWKSRTLEDLITVHNFKVCQLAFGDSHCIFITSSGHVYGYGDGDKGQLGTGNEDNHTKEPVQVLLPQCKVEDPCSNCAVIHIACGPYHSAAVLKNGSVYMWGSSDSGQCGIEMPAVLNPHHIKFEESYDDNDDMKSTQMYCHHNDPNQVFIVAISCGAEHTVALSSKHEVWVWGKGSAQLGLISVLWSCKPMKVPFLHQKTVLSVSCGLNHTAILVQKTNISTQDDDLLDSCKQCQLDEKQNNEELNESRVCPLGLPVSSLLASPVASSEILLDDENPLTESLEELPRPDHADVELGMNSLVLDDTLSCTETIQEKIIEAMVSSQSLTETGNMEISKGTDDGIENNACVGKENYFEESELSSLSIVDEQSAKAFLFKQLDTNNDNVLKKKSLKDSLLSSTTNAVSELYNSVNEKLEMLVQMQASPGIKLPNEIVKFSDLTKVTEPMIDQEQFSEEFCTKSSSLKSLDESGIFKNVYEKSSSSSLDRLLLDNKNRYRTYSQISSSSKVSKDSKRSSSLIKGNIQTELWTWGKGRNGQLGHGDMLERMQPCMVQSLANKNVMKVVAAGNHTAVMTSDSRIFTWGSNSCGQLGHSFSVSSVCSPTKIQLSGSTLVWDIAANVNCTTFLADGYGKQVGIFSCGEKSQEK